MSEHTPGPWVVDDLGEEFFLDTNHRFGIGAPSLPVYRVAKVEGMGGTSLANARLIAAAPTMLAALEAALARFRYIRTGGTGVEFADPAYLVGNEDVIRQLAAAIQAARGTEPARASLEG